MAWTPEMRERYKGTAEERRAKDRLRYEANPEKWRAMKARYYEKHKRKTLHRNWIRQIGELGCTPEMYQELLTMQNGVCAICGRENVSGRKLAVDHDHNTNEVRGLLCNPCNAGLGAFRDNPDQLRKALEYLCRSIR